MNDEVNDIFEDLPEDVQEPVIEAEPVLDFVTVRTAGGTNIDVPGITEPTEVGQILTLAHINAGNEVALFVDGAPVGRDFRVGPGATITLLSLQKGG